MTLIKGTFKQKQITCPFGNLGVRVVFDYADNQISNFVIENRRENEKVHETALACSVFIGVQADFLRPNNSSRKALGTCPLSAL